MATTTFVGSGNTFTAGDNSLIVKGATGGSETLRINNVTGLSVDANFERVELVGNLADYKFVITGTSGIQIVNSAGVTIATIPSLNQAETLAFADGSAVLTQTGATAANLNGVALSTTTPAAITTTLNTSDKSSIAGGGGGGSVAGQTFTLTNSAIPDSFALTAGNDTVTGASGTLASTDAVIDVSTTDNDTLTAQVTVATLFPTITKVENININGDFVTTGLDFTNIQLAKTVTFNTGITSGAATVGKAAATTSGGLKTTVAEKVVFGGNVTTATINTDDTGTGGTVNLDSGVLTALTFAAATPTAPDSFALTTNNVNITLNGLANVEALKITPTIAGKKITLGDAQTLTNSIDFANTVDSVVAGTAANLNSRIITKSGTAKLTAEVTAAGATDLTKAAVTDVTLTAAMGANTVTVKSGLTVTTNVDQGNAAFTLAAPASSASTNVVTFANSAANQTGLVGGSVKTLTITSSAPLISGVDATYAVLDNGTNNVVLGGTNDVKVTSGKAQSVDASSLVGFLDYTQSAAAATAVKGGSGANIISLKATTQDVTYVGQNGGDGVTLLSTTGGVNLTTGSGNDTITANALTTGAASITTGAGDDTVSATGLTSGVISAILGAGNDTLSIGQAATGAVVIAVDGGDGTDLLNIGKTSVIKGGTFSVSNVETIAITGGGAVEFSAAQLSGKTYSFKATNNAADELKVTGVATTTTIDLSGITTDQTVAAAVKLGTTIDATASTAAVTIKGTNQLDTVTVSANGSNITPGGGADTLTLAGGADKVIYGATTGAQLLTEAGSAASGATATAPTAAGDTVGTFTSGTDKIVLTVAFGTAGASGGLVNSSGTSYTTGSTALTTADFVSFALATDAVAANTANGGRFLFDTVAKTLYYDANGDTAITAGGVWSGAADDFKVVTTTGVNLVASDFAFG